MDTRLAVVVNANARRGAFARSGIGRLRAALSPGERLYVTHDLSELAAAGRALAEHPPEVLGLVGGDGTITAALSAVYQASGRLPPKLLMLRGGTMNTVARGVGVLRGDPLARLARYRAGRVVERRVYTLAAGEQLGFLFSAGLMHAFLAEYYRQPLGTGPLGAAGLLAAGVGSTLVGGALAKRLAKPVQAALSLDGTPRPPAPYLFIGAATVPEVGIGFRPYARVSDSPEGFQLLAYTGRLRGLVPHLPRFARGRGAPVPGTLDLLAREVVIDPGDEPLAFALDGDLHEHQGPLPLRLGPPITALL